MRLAKMMYNDYIIANARNHTKKMWRIIKDI